MTTQERTFWERQFWASLCVKTYCLNVVHIMCKRNWIKKIMEYDRHKMKSKHNFILNDISTVELVTRAHQHKYVNYANLPGCSTSSGYVKTSSSGWGYPMRHTAHTLVTRSTIIQQPVLCKIVFKSILKIQNKNSSWSYFENSKIKKFIILFWK